MSQARDSVPYLGSEAQPASRIHRWTGGVEGNARLIAWTGLLLLVLLFVEGLTLLRIRALLSVHVFVGLLLIPPILLKFSSTGYRFMRYYTGSGAYRAAGPPHPIPRLIAPFLVAATIGLFGTGIALLFVGPFDGGVWRRLHILFFVGWFGLMTIHVLTYLVKAPELALADLRQQVTRRVSGFTGGALTREGLLVGSFLLGLVLAAAFMSLDSSWMHWATLFHDQ